jgi:putative phage-type endonuclease
MITVDVQQGTPEWFAARCGIPSASNFDKIVTSTGAVSKQREKYLYQLVAERVTGRTEEPYTNGAMERGKEMEAEARQLYELINGVEIKQVGVCYPDKKKLWAASPDGLVGDDGLIEIKCPQAYAAVSYLLAGTLPTDYVQQVQGQMLTTDRKWVDFMSYYPGLKPMIVRVYRDEKFLLALDGELRKFAVELASLTERLFDATC